MSELSALATISDIDSIVVGKTVPTQFLELVRANPSSPALHSIKGESDWNVWTLSELSDLVARAAGGLTKAGVQPGQRVLLMMRNRPDFHWFDAAAQFLRATPVSIYNSSSPEEIQYLAGHAEAKLAIVEDSSFLDRLLQVRDELPLLKRIYVIEPPDGPLPDGVRPASELLESGSADLDALAAATKSEDIATLIYTSGTTGPPKGVMISQYNVVYTVEILRQCITTFDDYVGKRVVSYLPMAHIAERAVSHYQGLILGYSIYCCPDPGQLTAYLKEVRPQLIFGVPRVWEKIYNGVNAALSADPDRRAQFDDGVNAAIEIQRTSVDGGLTDDQRQTLDFLDSAAFANVRAMVGLDGVELAITGAAPIPNSVLEWFNGIGVPLTEVYGLSETTGPMTWSPSRPKIGTVGRGCPGMEVVIADDGEVICRGGNVFQGYMKQPEKTAETIVDGWFHSGDIGEMDDEGYISIVDRKKELIITSGGKNISPANLEAAMKTIPLIGQAAAVGDGRKFVSAILVLDPEAAPVWAKAHGKTSLTASELAADPDVLAEVQAGIERINAQFAQVEQIKKFTLVAEEWMPDSDMLTPTSKLKRRGVNSRYADKIEAMYEGLS
jgi:long-chain acyl-CoA synthetase